MKLTPASVKTLPAPATGSRIYFDDGQPGYGARVTAAGVRAYVIVYRVRTSRRQRVMTIGRCDVWAESAARKEAKRLRIVVDQGGDPLGDIETKRETPTINDLCDRFIAEYLPHETRAGTAKRYQGHIRRYVRPAFGTRKVPDVAFADVQHLHRKVTAERGPIGANRMMATLSSMFTQAVLWGMRPDNPCHNVSKNKERARKRYLKPDELDALVVALAGYRTQRIANIIRALLLSGARASEVCAMRWADLNLTEGTWLKPAETVKQDEDHDTPLSAPLRQLLAEIAMEQKTRGTDSEWVFPTRTGASTNYHDVWKAWREICATAGIKGVNIHDMRHHYASILVSSGASLPIIGQLLGHKDGRTTARYAHLFRDVTREATNRVGAVIANAGKESSEAIPFRRR
jgi:integrase